MRELNATALRQSLEHLARALKTAEAERRRLVEEILAERRPMKQPIERTLDTVRRRRRDPSCD